MIRILLCFSLMLSLSGSLPTDVESNAVNKEGMESVFAEVLRIDPTTREPRTYDFGLTGYDDDEEEVEEEDDEDEDHVDKKKTKDYELRKPGAFLKSMDFFFFIILCSRVYELIWSRKNQRFVIGIQ